ncbi:MFS general substrate transporter [Auricularia subglabra TFB-10046 SS5]|nr:MFS general substrate transporter [Auricularia subglabra TFB-10046 SS5]
MSAPSSSRPSLDKKSLSQAVVDEAASVQVQRVNPEDNYDPKFVRSTIRKVDMRLLPILGALYAFSLIDRTNISLARVVGAQQELGLDVGNRYNIIALVFFPPYILVELPSNVLLRRFGARSWLGFISIAWGATMLSMGFVKNWQSLAGCRALLGALEGGFFPGCVYLITTWYKRQEVQARLAFFYLLSTLVGGFSPIFAYGVSTIGEAAGLKAWRWIFIICGIVTCFFALLSFFLIVDFPDKASFLTPEQIKLVRDRVEYDRGDAVPDPLTWAKAARYSLDPKLWAFALMFCFTTMPSYAFSLFLPTILTEMGYSVKDSQLLMSPPYAVAVVLGLAVAVFADRVNKRGIFIVGQAAVIVVGLAMTAYSPNKHVRYAGAFLGVFGTQANIPAVIAYQSNNIVGQSKRSYSSALLVGFGGVGGIIASCIFRDQDKPKYLPGLWTSIGCSLATIALVGATSAWFVYRNNQVRRGVGKRGPIEGQPGFLYTL